MNAAVATPTALRIEALLSARLFVRPQLAGERLYFVSDLSGRLSLYAMDAAGGVPEPLLPPGIALQNPELLNGEPFRVVPHLERIVVMIDRDGDENYQPFLVPLDGGFPEPLDEAFSATAAPIWSRSTGKPGRRTSCASHAKRR